MVLSIKGLSLARTLFATSWSTAKFPFPGALLVVIFHSTDPTLHAKKLGPFVAGSLFCPSIMWVAEGFKRKDQIVSDNFFTCP